MSFAQTRILDLPKWLRGPQGERYSTALGNAYDVELANVKFAIKQRFPTICEDDALDTAGTTFRIERFDGEGYATYRARVLDAWPTWRAAGERDAIISSLHEYGVVDVEVYGNKNWIPR